MNKLTLNKTMIVGILIFICVHSGSILVTSILENFTKVILYNIDFSWTYGYLPWTRFIVLPFELYLILKYLKMIDDNQGIFDYSKILQLTILTIILLIGTQFRHELEPSNIGCGNIFLNEDNINQYRFSIETHSKQEYITGIIEKVLYGLFMLFVVLNKFQKSSKSI